MRPLLFQWRGIRIFSYPAMVYLGMVAGVVAGNLVAHAARLDAFRVYVATLVLFVPALTGARLFHVVMHWQLYRDDPGKAWRRNQGGAAQYGGLVLVLLCSVPLLAWLRLSFATYWDVAIFTILVLMIFGRVGCVLNGCCAGRRSDSWIAMRLPNHEGVWERRLPTQFLELGWAAVLLAGAILARPRLPFAGALFWLVTAGYAVGRLWLESMREESVGQRFTVQHGISVLLITLAIGVFAVGWPK